MGVEEQLRVGEAKNERLLTTKFHSFCIWLNVLLEIFANVEQVEET